MANEETWTKRIAEWRASGLTAREFCAGRDFKLAGLYWWSSNLQRAPSAKHARPVRLARVVRRPSEESATEGESGGEPQLVMIELKGARVFVTTGVERATLSTVLGALEERTAGPAR
jgi:hypothetical protein